MANHPNGGRSSSADEHRPNWRPQDQSNASSSRARSEDDHDYGSWRDRNEHVERDPRRWEGSRGSEVGSGDDRDLGRTEHYGQGQSGYSAGRHGEDRSHQGSMQNRNEMWSPSPGNVEDRRYEMGTDDRWTGRGGNDRADRRDRGYAPEGYGRSYENERSWRGGTQDQHYQGGSYEPRGYGQSSHGQGAGNYERPFRGPYDRGGYDQSYGNADRMARTNDMGPYDQRMGYQGGYPSGAEHMNYAAGAGQREGSDWSPSQRGVHESQSPQRHVHRGTGPHRGKGPQGYQRSDERIRELVCEALADDDQIDASQIQVSVKDGEVTLSGIVENRRIRREAEDCVSSVSGVRDVQLNLRAREDQRQNQSTNLSSSPSASSGTGSSAKIETETAGSMSSSTQDKKHRA